MTNSNAAFIKQRSFLTIASALTLFLVILPFSGMSNGFLIDRAGYVIGRDFLNYWQPGVAFWSDTPGLFYDVEVYNAHLDKLMGHDYKDQRWSYPPHVMILLAPFGLLSFYPALILFTSLSVFSFYKVVVTTLPQDHLKILLLLAPAVIMCVLIGQVSLFIAAIFVYVFKYIDERPIHVAILIALLTVKPQLGILIPIYLLATQRFRLFIYTTIAVMAFLSLSLLIQGVGIWQAFFESSGEQLQLLKYSNSLILGLMPSLTTQLALFGVSLNLAVTIHLCVSTLIVGAMIILMLKNKDHLPQFQIFMAATFVSTPYIMVYDTAVLCWLALYWLSLNQANFFQKWTYVLLLLLPVIGPVLSRSLGIGCGFILFAFTGWMFFDAYRQSILDSACNSATS